jgi:hypothetical protein
MPPKDALISVMTDDGPVTGTLETGLPMNTAYAATTDSDARLGYVELFEMATIPHNYVFEGIPVAAGITHQNGVPTDCTVVPRAWVANDDGSVGGNDGGWGWQVSKNMFNRSYLTVPAGTDLGEPTGGLYAQAVYLEMDTAAAYVADGVNIADYSDLAQHYRPDDVNNFLLPSLASGSVRNSMVVGAASDPVGKITATTKCVDDKGAATIVRNWPLAWDATYVDGDPATPPSGSNIYPLAHVLGTYSVMNEYFVDATYDGQTDWVVTLPLKKHGVPYNSPTIDIFWWDREEQQFTDVCDPSTEACFGVSPVIVTDIPTTVLPNEVSVVQWGTESVLSPDNDSLFDMNSTVFGGEGRFDGGWAKLSFISFTSIGSPVEGSTIAWAYDYDKYTTSAFASSNSGGSVTTTGTDVFNALPAIGFAAIRGSAGGDLRTPADALFGETMPHKVNAYKGGVGVLNTTALKSAIFKGTGTRALDAYKCAGGATCDPL